MNRHNGSWWHNFWAHGIEVLTFSGTSHSTGTQNEQR
jgi:hypothetical protein